MLRKTFLLFFLIAPLSVNAQVNEAAVSETLMMCANLDMYGDMALRQKEIAMSKDIAASLISDSIRKNMKMPFEMTEAMIKVVDQIYDRVYSDTSINKGNIESVIISACSKYKGYNVDQHVISKYFAVNPRSAWDPLVRVPRCTKAAQSAANIATARDRGMKKEQIRSAAESGLTNDAFTLESLPRLIDDAYENADISVASFFAYNLARCNLENDGNPFKEIMEIKTDILKCQEKPSREEKANCTNALFGLKI